MKLVVISFTDRGSMLAGSLVTMLAAGGYECQGTAVAKYAGRYGLTPLQVSLREWTGEMFDRVDGIIFIGATGIAVRAIAPYLKSKQEDPAVIVMDEKGMFVISLLSGHIGGGNELTGMLANLTGAMPVITTATDINGRFAVDVFAKKNGLTISDMKAAKKISADILDEQPVGLLCEVPVLGEVPEELSSYREGELFEGECGIVISYNEEKSPFPTTLHLIPRSVTVGVGCRRGIDSDQFEEAVMRSLRRCHLALAAVEQLASIDLKQDEPAIINFSRKYQIPFVTYTPEQLSETPGSFTPSEFVKATTGVDNICERSAVRGSGGGRILQGKRAENGITTAIGLRERSVDFG